DRSGRSYSSNCEPSRLPSRRTAVLRADMHRTGANAGGCCSHTRSNVDFYSNRLRMWCRLRMRAGGPCAAAPPSVQTGVGVQSGDHDVDEEQVEDQHQEPGDVDPRRPLGAPPGRRARVEVHGVEDPRDERDGLLGIPTPETAPGALRPDGAQDDAHAEDRECDHRRAVRQSVEGVRLRQRAGQAGRPALLLALRLPHPDQMPEPSDTIDTWIGNQNDCSAGTTGAASEYRWVPPKYSRSSTGTSTNGHATWNAGLRRKTRAATTPSAHVTEMNSYMLPHGKRPIANARTTSDPMWKTKARHTRSCVIRAHPAPRVEEVSSSPVSVIDDDSVSPSPSVATSSRVAVFCTRTPA